MVWSTVECFSRMFPIVYMMQTTKEQTRAENGWWQKLAMFNLNQPQPFSFAWV